MNFIKTAKKHGLKAAFVATALTAVSSANAALPPVIATTVTALQADASDLADIVWPVVAAIFGSMLLIKLFKRFGSKI